MDDAQRTASNPIEAASTTPFEVPPNLLDLLRNVAVDGVERAAEHPDVHRDDDARQRLWDAVVLWGTITYSEASGGEVAALATNAIEWLRHPDQHPLKATDRDRLAANREHLKLLEQLMDLREAAAIQDARHRADVREYLAAGRAALAAEAPHEFRDEDDDDEADAVGPQDGDEPREQDEAGTGGHDGDDAPRGDDEPGDDK